MDVFFSGELDADEGYITDGTDMSRQKLRDSWGHMTDTCLNIYWLKYSGVTLNLKNRHKYDIKQVFRLCSEAIWL